MLLDNKNHGKVIQAMRQEIQQHSKISIISGLFSIYAFSALKKELHSVDTVRLLLSEWTDKIIPSISGTQLEIPLKNALTQARIANECKIWLETKASIRTNANISIKTPA